MEWASEDEIQPQLPLPGHQSAHEVVKVRKEFFLMHTRCPVDQPWCWCLSVEREAGVLKSYYLGKVSDRENRLWKREVRSGL